MEACIYVNVCYIKLTNLLSLFLQLDIMEPKVPEDIYKTHLEHVRECYPHVRSPALLHIAAPATQGSVQLVRWTLPRATLLHPSLMALSIVALVWTIF